MTFKGPFHPKLICDSPGMSSSGAAGAGLGVTPVPQSELGSAARGEQEKPNLARVSLQERHPPTQTAAPPGFPLPSLPPRSAQPKTPLGSCPAPPPGGRQQGKAGSCS